MTLTRSFKDTVIAGIGRVTEFRDALLRDGVESLLPGDVDTGMCGVRLFPSVLCRSFPCRRADGCNSPSATLLFTIVQAVTDPGFRQQIAGASGVGFQFMAQLPHINPQIVAVFDVARSPDFFQQLPMGDDKAGMANQFRQ